MQNRFDGKVALVTGAAGFIGNAVARRLASEGATVVVADIREDIISQAVERVNETARNAGSVGKAVGKVLNVRDSADVRRVFTEVAQEFSTLDIMIHAAGGSARSRCRLAVDQTDDVIDEVLGVNLMGAIYCTREALKIMTARDVKGGRIINFSSAVGINGLKCCAEYAAAKGGVLAFTKTVAKEAGQYGITANCVCPGIVKRPEEVSRDVTNTNFLGFDCTDTDVASLTCFLASEEARFITGQGYVIDGGRSIAMKGSE